MIEVTIMESTVQFDIECHPLTKTPNEAWKEFDKKAPTVKPMPLDTPVKEDAVRFVCIANTHSSEKLSKRGIPPGDILLHAGDFTMAGMRHEIQNFSEFLGTLSHSYKVVIAGEHELSFEPFKVGRTLSSATFSPVVKDPRPYLTNCIYLQDSSVEIYGLSIYGTPWVPKYNNWAFNLPRGQACVDKWNQIPPGIDILLSHTPPLGHGDVIYVDKHIGDVELLLSVQHRIKPKYHVFGHIQRGYGVSTDYQTIYVNCSSCDARLQFVNDPIIFDIPLPEGQEKK